MADRLFLMHNTQQTEATGHLGASTDRQGRQLTPAEMKADQARAPKFINIAAPQIIFTGDQLLITRNT